MFGGLDIKGSSSNDKKEEQQQQQPSSAFSFLGGQQAPAPSTEASGFSFMSTSGSAPAEPPKATQAPTSSFSFLSGTPAPAPVIVQQNEKPQQQSGFGFMQQQQTPATTEIPSPPKESASPSTTAPSSSFGFMSASSGEREPFTTGIGARSASDSDHNSAAPVGSGIVFGGAATAAATKKPIKKRSRAQKVGAARAAELPPPTNVAPPRPSYSASPQPPAPKTASPPAPAEVEPVNTKEAAMESVQRAQEFMAQKSMQAVTTAAAPSTSTGPSYTSTAFNSSSGYVEDYGSGPTTPPKKIDPATTVWANSPEDDDDYVAAKAAAQEAQLKMASGKNQGPGGGSLLGGLFSRKAPLWNNNSQHSLPSVTSNETPAERMQREQEEAKRAMAERNLAAMQQQQEVVPPPPQESHTLVVEQQHEKSPTTETAPSSTWAPPAIQRTSWTRPTVSASPPSPPPKIKTPAEKLQDLLQDFDEDVHKAMNRVAELRLQRNMLLDERLLSLAKERLATQSMAAAETQQMAAAEAEDYDLADRLAQVIDCHAREKAELSSILENIERALVQLDSQKVQVVCGVAKCFEQVKQKLEEFQSSQKTNDKKDDTASMNRFANTAKQLSAEVSRLERDAKHLERDEKIVAEERKDLEMSISEQTADMEKQRDSARASLVTIEEEIEILRRQLEAKETTAASLKAEVASFENDISKIRENFSRQLTRVERKEASVKDNRHEWEKEKIALEARKTAHEKEVKEHSEALLAHDALLTRLAKEITLADTFESIVAKEVVFENSADQDVKTDDEFAKLQVAVVKCEANVSEGKQILKAAEEKLNALKDEQEELSHRIPVLEETKKAAAASRDFKAAGKASKQIKDATSKLKECEEVLMVEAEERKNAALADLATLEAELKATQAVANEKEREAGIAAMKKVVEKIKSLAETKKKVGGSTEEEKGVQAVGTFVLSAQIDVLISEGSAYGAKFGGWDEIVKELVDKGVLDEASTVSPTNSAPPSPDRRPNDEINEEAIAKFREVTRRLQEAEEALEAAVEKEDYEAAAELDEELEQIKAEWKAIDLTDAEMKIFLGEDEDVEASEAETAEAPEAPNAADDISEEDDEASQSPSADEVSDSTGGDEESNGESESNRESGSSDGESESDSGSASIEEAEAAVEEEEEAEEPAEEEEVAAVVSEDEEPDQEVAEDDEDDDASEVAAVVSEDDEKFEDAKESDGDAVENGNEASPSADGKAAEESSDEHADDRVANGH